jgi:GMP synthase-like glutamine amidotransferase
MTRVAIIEADTPVPAVVAELGTYGTIFTNLLVAAGLSQETTRYSVHNVVEHPENLPNLEDPVDPLDAVLISGSKHNSYDDVDWINQLAAFVNAALAKGVRVVGICFGHQVIARALGAKVGVNPKGWEIAAVPITLTEKGQEVFAELVETAAKANGTINIMQMHRDIVFEVPTGTELLAYNDICGVQGFYKRGVVWTVQGHPEFTEFIETSLISLRRDLGAFTAELAADGLKRAHDRNDGPIIAKSIVRFIRDE